MIRLTVLFMSYFHFQTENIWFFSDMRKFGKIILVETKKLSHSPHLVHLGPEPLEKSSTIKNSSQDYYGVREVK